MNLETNLKRKFYGRIVRNALVIEKKSVFEDHLATLDGKDIEITIGKRTKSRSLKENAYYWGVIIPAVAGEMGIDPDEAHTFLKSQFLKRGVYKDGKRFQVIGGTARLTTDAFEEYAEDCRRWASQELNISIPLPNEVELPAYA